MRFLLSLLLALTAAPAFAQATPPDALVKSITEDVIQIIRKDREIRAGNPKRIAEVVETKILPHFDFARMTRIAMAVNWRRATPEQQKALTEEFKTLLVRTYSNALTQYRDQVVDYKPLRARPDDAEVTVKSEIRQKGAQSVALDYDLERTPAGWKVFDVKVGGVSLITTYREDFAGQVRESGIDGLIKVLAAKNRSGETRKPAS
ncbi:MAG: ABC transporter substrate-binding protein [Betaproteobacteria bacterium]|nr:ABC transporter substrate-binding protein [Betaproteobacteria bacterium]